MDEVERLERIEAGKKLVSYLLDRSKSSSELYVVVGFKRNFNSAITLLGSSLIQHYYYSLLSRC